MNNKLNFNHPVLEILPRLGISIDKFKELQFMRKINDLSVLFSSLSLE